MNSIECPFPGLDGLPPPPPGSFCEWNIFFFYDNLSSHSKTEFFKLKRHPNIFHWCDYRTPLQIEFRKVRRFPVEYIFPYLFKI